MPSPRVLDLSPTYNQGWADFGKSFTDTLNEHSTNDRDRDTLNKVYGEEKNPLKRLGLLDSPEADRLNPKRRRQERLENIENANMLQEQDRIDREIKKAKGQEQINFIDKYYGEPMKMAANALVKAREKGLSTPEQLSQLQSAYDKSHNAWQGALRKHAPEGFFPAIADEAGSMPNAPQESNAQAAAPTPIDPITTENLPGMISAAKQAYKDNPKQLKASLEELIKEANPDEVPAKVARLVQEEIKGRELKPRREEIEQLEKKDAKQKQKNAVIGAQQKNLEKTIKDLNKPENFSRLTRNGVTDPDKLIDRIMNLYGVPEQDAVSKLLMALDFDFVSQEEQEELYDFWEGHSDTERGAVVATLKQLMSTNYRRWVSQK